MAAKGFTVTQKQYLEGLASGLRLARRNRQTRVAAPPPLSAQGTDRRSGPDFEFLAAQDRFLAAGQRLSIEERAKRRRSPDDFWPRLRELSRSNEFPSGDDVFLCKFHGLFYASPAEEAYMCRLRLPGGVLTAHQLAGVAELARRNAHPSLQITARSNLQLRGIRAQSATSLLEGLLDLGIVTRGTGADGVRNVCASPTAGIDRRELIDTMPFARRAHHLVLSDRSLQALPRKFTVAFDGGGAVSAFAGTSDVGFCAVKVAGLSGLADGVYFRLLLGGATSHSRHARDAGMVVRPERAIDVLEEVLRIYSQSGDRTNRRRARLAYLIESEGLDRFVARVRARLDARGLEDALTPLALEACDLPPLPDPMAHVGFHNQLPRGRSYVGLALPSGTLTLEQAEGIANVASTYGTGEIRCTLQQTVLIPGLMDNQLHRVRQELEALSLRCTASPFRAGMMACTGKNGCQFAAANTRRIGNDLVRHLESAFKNRAEPISIRVDGCHHSCAQHGTADVGLLAVRRFEGSRDLETYQLWLGGTALSPGGMGREVESNLRPADVNRAVVNVMSVYLERRRPRESFSSFVRRASGPELRGWTRGTEAEVPADG